MRDAEKPHKHKVERKKADTKEDCESHSYQLENRQIHLCSRTRDSGSFVGVSAWEGQEGFGVRVIYSFFVWVLLTQMETH